MTRKTRFQELQEEFDPESIELQLSNSYGVLLEAGAGLEQTRLKKEDEDRIKEEFDIDGIVKEFYEDSEEVTKTLEELKN